MRGFNFNISSFFGKSGSGSPFGSFNFGDYASIKNGSYKKLLKSYYAEQKKDAVSEKKDAAGKKDTAGKTKKEQAVDSTGLTQMKKEADGLKTAADALKKDELWKQTDGAYDMGRIAGAVKMFANEYNDVVSQSGKVSSKGVSQSVHYMNSMTNTMSKALSKIGVTVGKDGKLSVDEDALKKANVSEIKSLFTGAGSYGSQIADRAHEISRETIMNSSIYSGNGTLSSAMGSMFNKWT